MACRVAGTSAGGSYGQPTADTSGVPKADWIIAIANGLTVVVVAPAVA